MLKVTPHAENSSVSSVLLGITNLTRLALYRELPVNSLIWTELHINMIHAYETTITTNVNALEVRKKTQFYIFFLSCVHTSMLLQQTKRNRTTNGNRKTVWHRFSVRLSEITRGKTKNMKRAKLGTLLRLADEERKIVSLSRQYSQNVQSHHTEVQLLNV